MVEAGVLGNSMARLFAWRGGGGGTDMDGSFDMLINGKRSFALELGWINHGRLQEDI